VRGRVGIHAGGCPAGPSAVLAPALRFGAPGWRGPMGWAAARAAPDVAGCTEGARPANGPPYGAGRQSDASRTSTRTTGSRDWGRRTLAPFLPEGPSPVTGPGACRGGSHRNATSTTALSPLSRPAESGPAAAPHPRPGDPCPAAFHRLLPVWTGRCRRLWLPPRDRGGRAPAARAPPQVRATSPRRGSPFAKEAHQRTETTLPHQRGGAPGTAVVRSHLPAAPACVPDSPAPPA
jgi:hypothetical protein